MCDIGAPPTEIKNVKDFIMRYKRRVSAVIALGLIAMISVTTPKSDDAIKFQAINSDLMWLTISSFKQINEQVQECAHNSNCNK